MLRFELGLAFKAAARRATKGCGAEQAAPVQRAAAVLTSAGVLQSAVEPRPGPVYHRP